VSFRLLLCLAAGLWGAGCFSVPPLTGPYGCGEGARCKDGLVCWDGVCCRPDAEPLCVGYVFDGGLCADGSSAQVYSEDLDGDGFGSSGQTRLYCSAPVSDPYVQQVGDCDDRAGVGALSHPGLLEVCDGRDNDCDGNLDESFPHKTFYADQDLDGFGDPAQSIAACEAPEGYVGNNLDCAPNEARAFPGAAEACNNADDDCDGAVDEQVPALGVACTNAAKFGVCRPGVTACVSGAEVCQSTVAPSRDVCDGKDNDCDNQTDEKPDCKGPSTVLSGTGITRGARNLGETYNGVPSTCLKDGPGGLETFQPSGANHEWLGSTPNSHVAWAQAPAGTFWDLRGASEMFLSFDYALTNAGSPPWSTHYQPGILICSPNGFIRMAHSSSYLLSSSASGRLVLRVPMGFNQYGWVVGSNSSADLQAVLSTANRIEVLIQPFGTSVSFRLLIDSWGFY